MAITFTGTPNSGIDELKVQYLDGSTSMAANKWLWFFGDGNKSTEKNPAHIYKMPGKYTVRLDVWDDSSSVSGTETKIDYITVYDNGVTSSDLDVSRTNKSYKYGLKKAQGFGVSENNSTGYPMPMARSHTMFLTDAMGQPHSLVLDYRDGKFYDIALYDGPSGTGLVTYWKDRVTVSGSGGYDKQPTVKFKEDTGEYERFFIRKVSDNIGIRPYRETYRSISGLDGTQYDSNGLPSGVTFDISVFKDGQASTATATSQDISFPKHEVVYDRIIDDCHRLQTKVVGDKAPYRITHRQNNFIVYDKQDDPTGKTSTEDNWQEALAHPTIWLTRGTNLVDRISGTTKSGAITNITGPDGRSGSAFTITTQIALSNSSIVGGTVLLWHKTGYSISGITLTQVGSSGSWILSKYTGTIPASLVLPVGDVYDVRIYSSTLSSNSMTYCLNDVVYNTGDNIMGLF